MSECIRRHHGYNAWKLTVTRLDDTTVDVYYPTRRIADEMVVAFRMQPDTARVVYRHIHR